MGVEGMIILVDEATDMLPPPPNDFPTCRSFKWGDDEFSDWLGQTDESNEVVEESKPLDWLDFTNFELILMSTVAALVIILVIVLSVAIGQFKKRKTIVLLSK